VVKCIINDYHFNVMRVSSDQSVGSGFWFELLVRAFGSSFWFGLLAHPSFVRSRLPKGTVLQREMTSGILVSEQCNNIGNRVCPG